MKNEVAQMRSLYFIFASYVGSGLYQSFQSTQVAIMGSCHQRRAVLLQYTISSENKTTHNYEFGECGTPSLFSRSTPTSMSQFNTSKLLRDAASKMAATLASQNHTNLFSDCFIKHNLDFSLESLCPHPSLMKLSLLSNLQRVLPL